MKQAKRTKQWLRAHSSDPYVKLAQQAGYRSRAAYKLLEIQEKDRLFKPGMTVVDLGAAPGGWTQVALRCVGDVGRVIALDVLPMETIDNVLFIQGDFTDDDSVDRLNKQLEQSQRDYKVDVVISDMAPNLTGINSIDQPAAISLAEAALAFAISRLRPEGTFLVKVFQGEGFGELMTNLRRVFKKVQIRKPKASKPHSREMYIVACTLTSNE